MRDLLNSDREVDRIVRAYKGYRKSRQHQWDDRNLGNREILTELRTKIRMSLIDNGLFPLDGKQILEVGCGTAHRLASLQEFGAQPQHLYGVDLLSDRIQKAQRRYPLFHFSCGNAEQLDFPQSTFDLILLFTVFSSILDSRMAQNVASEVRRVLKPSGAVLWYDFRYNNPFNPHVNGVSKRQVNHLFPEFRLDSRTLTLLPPLARRLGRLTRLFYPTLSVIAPLRTHCLAVLSR